MTKVDEMVKIGTRRLKARDLDIKISLDQTWDFFAREARIIQSK